MEIDSEATQAAILDSKYYKFIKWLKEWGAKFPRVTFPVIFENGVCGVAANAEIKPYEAFMFIPVKDTVISIPYI